MKKSVLLSSFRIGLAFALISGTTIIGSVVTAANSTTFAQDEPRRQSAPSLNPTVAKAVQEAITVTQPESGDPTDANFRQAIGILDNLIASRGDNLKGYDKAIVYQVRGGFKINLEDNAGALRDFETAIDTRSLPVESENGLRYAVAQLHFSLENYDKAIAGLKEWLRLSQAEGKAPPANAYYLLGLAYVAKEDFRSAQEPMETALRLKNAEGGKPDKNYYNVLNLIYSEVGNNAKRAALLETMINIWPEDGTYWKQLAGAYAVDKKDREAFSVLEVAYQAGLLSKEDEIIQLIQYYSFYENAFRGAKLLEREMAAGTVRRNEQNLILLSQLWDQSREAKKAIPILEEAARTSGRGDLYFRLGRVLVADEQYVKAEEALLKAINSRQLREKDLADAWLLLGNARFSRAGPDDVRQRNRAREAFVNATRYPTTRRDAQRWVAYIDEVNKVQRLAAEREKQEIELLCQQDLERLQDAIRIIQLRGETLDSLSPALVDNLKTCGYDREGKVIPGGKADKNVKPEPEDEVEVEEIDPEATEGEGQ